MTLIKKINKIHTAATTANLLSMAVLMSLISCGDNGGESGELDFTLTADNVTVASAVQEAEVKPKIKVNKGELSTKSIVNVTDITADTSTIGTKSAAVISSDSDGKDLNTLGAGTDPIKKDQEKAFTVKVKSSEHFGTNNPGRDVAKITFKVQVTAKKEGEKGEGVKRDATCIVTVS